MKEGGRSRRGVIVSVRTCFLVPQSLSSAQISSTTVSKYTHSNAILVQTHTYRHTYKDTHLPACYTEIRLISLEALVPARAVDILVFIVEKLLAFFAAQIALHVRGRASEDT